MINAERFSWRWSGAIGLGHIGVDAEPVVPCHPDGLRLIEYWQSKASAECLPRWNDIVPREIIRLIPNVLLSNRTPEGWRYRLFGTALATRCGVDWTGRLLDEVYNRQTFLACERLYESLSRRRLPIHIAGHYLGLDIEHARIEAVHLPVIGRDNTIWVMAGVFFYDTHS